MTTDKRDVYDVMTTEDVQTLADRELSRRLKCPAVLRTNTGQEVACSLSMGHEDAHLFTWEGHYDAKS